MQVYSANNGYKVRKNKKIYNIILHFFKSVQFGNEKKCKKKKQYFHIILFYSRNFRLKLYTYDVQLTMVSPFPSHFAVIMTNGRGLKTPLLSTRGPNSLKTYIIFPTSGYFNEAPLIFDTKRGEKRFSFLFTVSIGSLFSYIYKYNL